METKPVKKIQKTPRKPRTKQLTPVSPEAMMMQAMKEGASIEIMERLLDLRERIQKDEAEKAFRKAMSAFQAECPVIVKSNNVDFTSKKSGTRVKYQYASLDKIVKAVKDILGKYELSYTFTTQQAENTVTAVCHVFHVAGHTESTFFTIPIDAEAFMNGAQKVAAALTYSKRYAFCNAFGILTGDIDDDGSSLTDDKKKEQEEKAQEAREQLKRFLENYDYVKKAFDILDYTDRAQWTFCNGHGWKPEMIKKHLNQLVDQKK